MYSGYARGLDALWPMWQWLDRAPLGRNEGDLSWFHRHDEYSTSRAVDGSSSAEPRASGAAVLELVDQGLECGDLVVERAASRLGELDPSAGVSPS